MPFQDKGQKLHINAHAHDINDTYYYVNSRL